MSTLPLRPAAIAFLWMAWATSALAEPSKPLTPALVESALAGDLKTIKQALTDGLAVDARDVEERTLLMFASYNGHHELVKLLVDAGANVNLADKLGRAPLTFAATGPNVETVKLLLESGAKVNATDSGEKWTALMMASAEGHPKVVELLLAHGADATMKDTDGDTSAHFARQRGHEELAKRLEKAAAR